MKDKLKIKKIYNSELDLHKEIISNNNIKYIFDNFKNVFTFSLGSTVGYNIINDKGKKIDNNTEIKTNINQENNIDCDLIYNYIKSTNNSNKIERYSKIYDDLCT